MSVAHSFAHLAFADQCQRLLDELRIVRSNGGRLHSLALPCIAQQRCAGNALLYKRTIDGVEYPRVPLEYLRTINGVDRLERERRIAIDFEEGRCARAVEHHVEADDVEAR